MGQLFMFLADAGISMSDIAPTVSMIGSLGISIWYVYWNTTVAIPKKDEAHRLERDQMLARFDKAMSDARKDYQADVQQLLAELKETRAMFAQWMTRQVA